MGYVSSLEGSVGSSVYIPLKIQRIEFVGCQVMATTKSLRRCVRCRGYSLGLGMEGGGGSIISCKMKGSLIYLRPSKKKIPRIHLWHKGILRA